jgi:hypothetical protein
MRECAIKKEAVLSIRDLKNNANFCLEIPEKFGETSTYLAATSAWFCLLLWDKIWRRQHFSFYKFRWLP